MTPVVVTFATLFALASVNQRLPSGPAVMPSGRLAAAGMGYSVTTPEVVILPTWFTLSSVNQMLPSGPATIANGPLLAVGSG